MTEYKDNSEKYNNLRQEYKTFVYEDFSITLGKEDKEKGREYIKIQFVFSCNEIRFSPYQIIYKKDFFHFNNDLNQLNSFAFNLGLIELISYWKATCSPQILIKCGFLDSKQQQFWKKLWFNGLGEFFYLNNIRTNINDFVQISCLSTQQFTKQSFSFNEDFIVPIGGGKDSVVTLELLRGNGKQITPMVINQRLATKECIEVGGYKDKDTIEIKRIIDKQLLTLNSKGYLNGHTPFSAMLAFTTLICAVLSQKKYIALSNENSANQATVYQDDKYADFNGVNHQYSKSLEFEDDFRSYYKEYLCSQIEYFSFLRPISELKIAEIFSYLPYFHVFKSCNVGSKQDIWCGNCPKCLFAYIILSPFIDKATLYSVFGKNMFEDEGLLTYFKELTGENEVKPFECVGTVEEVNMAIRERIHRFGATDEEILLKHWLSTDLKDKYECFDFDKFKDQEYENYNLLEDLKHSFKDFYIIVKKSELVKRLKKEKIAVMGLGREGLASLKLFNEILPQKQLILYDENEDKFLQNKELTKHHRCFSSRDDLTTINDNCSLIFFTPGMAPKDYPEIDFKKLTNQCDVFLSLFHNQCIGISGTKGKSTTSSLIYHIIKERNDNCILAGNIGIPFFDILPEINHKTQIVLELSCHQLQLIKRSPKVSVLLNLFEEHLDHYINFEDYQLSKMNLLFKAEKDDIFIYNADDKLINQWITRWTNYKKEKTIDISLIGFHLSDYKYEESKFLSGSHNKYNILAALNAVQKIGIDDNTAIASALTFKGLQHRMQFIGEKNKVRYYDDSISTIPQATLAAVRSLPNVSTLILGGMDRGIDYSPIKEVLKVQSIENIVFVGKAGKRMYDILELGFKDIKAFETYNTLSEVKNILLTNNWEEISEFCQANAKKGTSVLLSPAASSYDQFKNFEQRGDYFKNLIFQTEV